MSSSQEEEADYCARMYQIRKTCFSMLQDRGFEVAERDRSESFDTFKSQCTQHGQVNDPAKLTMRATRQGRSQRRVIILFSGKKDKFATDDVKYLFSQVDEEWQKHEMDHSKDQLSAILVIYKTMTSFAKKFLVSENQKRNQGSAADSVAHMRLDVSVFFEPELVVNVTQHEAVPRHRLLPAKEKKALLSRFKVTEDQLPRIPLMDPVAKYLGLRRGDVVEIERESETAGRYITYRTCL
jgi:DNA-directed RNA polymerase I, II, and III subunit RPABC1